MRLHQETLAGFTKVKLLFDAYVHIPTIQLLEQAATADEEPSEPVVKL
ncbi:MAG: hypothetical protein KDB00_29475 [Planctomycetales bacterium]|nr:hypothetical protein [Planctomycetales bacterium]